MPENRKYFVNGAVHLITARTEEGLPFVPSSSMNFIIWSVLARACTLYKIRICHFLFMGNHFHMVVVVDDPEHVSAFVGYVKAETAHATNRLLGRRRKTIWEEGYDSPALLTSDDVLRYIAYVYLNPARANLTDSIDEYPGVSSWEMFNHAVTIKRCPYLNRNLVPKLPLPALSINEQRKLAERFDQLADDSCELLLEPFAWIRSFPDYANKSEDEIKTEVIEKIREIEGKYRQKRRNARKSVLGSTALRRQSMLKAHTPTQFGRRMICICSDKELRKRYIAHFRQLCAEARKAFERWKLGDFTLGIPPGMFAPHLPGRCSAIPLQV